MMLFHGSNVAVSTILLDRCQPNKDFGKGFYTTSLSEQAGMMAKRVARRFGGVPCISTFSIEDGFQNRSDLSIKIFAEVNIEWAMFVLNNRYPKSEKSNALADNNVDCKYDIVIGPVANDDLSVIFRLFERGIISKESLVREMKYRKMTNQYSFHTERAVALLHYEGSVNV